MRTYVAKTPMAPVVGVLIALIAGAMVAALRDHRAVAWDQTPPKPSAPPSPLASRVEMDLILRSLQRLDGRLPWRDNRLEFGWRSPQDSYEAIRVQAADGPGRYYLRVIPRLTRPVVPNGGGNWLFLEDTLAPGAPPSGQGPHYEDIDWERVRALSEPAPATPRTGM